MTDDIMTTEDVEEVRASIQTAKDSLYKKEEGAVVTEVHPLVREILAGENKALITEQLDYLEREMSSYGVLNVSIPFIPRREFIRKICVWLSRTLNKKVILALTFDSTLLGGCTLSYEGKYLDHSLRRAVDEYFSKRENYDK